MAGDIAHQPFNPTDPTDRLPFPFRLLGHRKAFRLWLLALALLPAVLSIRLIPFLCCGAATDARVINVERRGDGDKTSRYFTVEYADGSGSKHRFTTSVSGFVGISDRGTVKVVYDPKRPGDAVIYHWWDTFSAPALSLIFLLLLGLLGLAFSTVMRKQQEFNERLHARNAARRQSN